MTYSGPEADELLFTVELAVAEESLTKFDQLLPGKSGMEFDLRTLLSTVKCRAGVGKPIAARLQGVQISQDDYKSAKIAGNFRDYEFYLVKFACNFEEPRGCSIQEGRFEVQLELADPGPCPPIAIDLFPREVLAKVGTTKTVAEIGADLKFYGAGPSAKRVHEIEVESYHPIIKAYGTLCASFRWRFIRIKDNPMEGDKILYATIGKPKGSSLLAKFTLSIEAQVKGLRGLISLSAHKHRQSSEFYPIC